LYFFQSRDINTLKKKQLHFILKEEVFMTRQLTAIIEREGNGYVALCPELDIASQGDSIETARENLREALELFFEYASPEEVNLRLHDEVYITQLEVAIG
jgi:predicted RNase H-like HicB family nuclease